MSEEETKVEAATEAPATEGSTTEEAAPKKKGKKWSIVVGVVVVVLIAAGAGFWVWHEQPSFCAAAVVMAWPMAQHGSPAMVLICRPTPAAAATSVP